MFGCVMCRGVGVVVHPLLRVDGLVKPCGIYWLLLWFNPCILMSKGGLARGNTACLERHAQLAATDHFDVNWIPLDIMVWNTFFLSLLLRSGAFAFFKTLVTWRSLG